MTRTTRDYWDAGYRAIGGRARAMVDPTRSYFVSELLDFLRPHLPISPSGRPNRLLEMGCGDSHWLPYFAARLGYEVAGVDYSPRGCEMARANLAEVGAGGEVWCADFTHLPPELLGRFDIVISMGVVEHFDDTTAIVGNFAACLAPGGRLVTTVPNMAGRMGELQRRVAPAVFDMHVPLTMSLLASAHERAGLRIRAAGHFGFAALGMVNYSSLPAGRWLGRAAAALDVGHLAARRLLRLRRQSPQWSSYVGVVAEKPVET